MRLKFAALTLDTRAGRLLRGEDEVQLTPLAYRLIALLAGRPGELVSRDEIVATLWSDTIVTGNSLDQLVRRVRRALGPDVRLSTVPGRGYRLDATVEIAGPPPPAARSNGPMFGRAAELDLLRQYFARGARLVTLLGPGGSGKTTLAGRALEVLDSGRGLFVDLSTATTVTEIAHDLALALGVGIEPDPVAQVGAALARLGSALVVLDNLEQAASAAAATIPRWAAEAPELALIVTSRVVLGLPGEQILPVGPLTSVDALALFADRSGLAADPAAAALVDALDRLPLAIELAARRARVVSPAILLARMRDRFGLLVDPASDRPDRHRSMTAALLDSWDLLDRGLQQDLARLTAFTGKFDLLAAEAVLGRDGIEVVQALVDRSLLFASPATGRFVLLDTVRAFVRERSDPSLLVAAEMRHDRWFTRHAGAGGLPSADARPAIAAELKPILAAARHAFDRGDLRLAARAALCAWEEMQHTGPLDLAVELLEGALEVDDPELAIEVRRALGRALCARRPNDAVNRLEEAVALAASDRVSVLLLDLASALRTIGELDRAEQALTDALARLRAAGDRYHEGLALTRLGAVVGRRGRAAEATALHASALAVFRAIHDDWGIATAAANLGIELDAAGRAEDAAAHYREALALWAVLGNVRGEMTTRGNLAVLLARVGKLDEAVVAQQGALDAARALADDRIEALHLANLGALHLERGELAEAERALMAAGAQARRLGNPVLEGHALVSTARLRRRQGAMHAARAALAHAIPRLGALGERRLLAAARVELAALERATGDEAAAERAIAEATRDEAMLDALTRRRLDALRGGG